jgi:two-component system sensor histidine kinase KdpD
MSAAGTPTSYPPLSAGPRASALHYLLAALGCAATAAIAAPLARYFDSANIVMVFLLVVVLIATSLGRGPAIMAAFLSVALFDFFFVPPTFSLTVSDAQYLLTFAVMLTVALITGNLTAGLRRQAQAASAREARTRALYEMARVLTGALSVAHAADVVHGFVEGAIGGDAVVFIPDEHEKLQVAGRAAGDAPRKFDAPILELVQREGKYVRLDFQAYYPMHASTRLRGVLAVSFDAGNALAIYEHHALLEAVASLIAIVAERLHYVEVANAGELQIRSERLRSSILSALSHDIRTPLTVLTGLADSLSVARAALPARELETATAIRDQARRLSSLVTNLLEMAKLNAGEVKLKREWQPLEEVVGASLKLLGSHLDAHPVRIDLPPDLPLVEIDAVLVERVLCNLLENAVKFSPRASPVELSARVGEDRIEVSVRDHGPGVEPAQQTRIFEMFARGEKESATPGVGLGLAISRAIVECHGGTIGVVNEPSGGARFTFTLPRGEPPPFEEEAEAAAR